MKKSIYFVTPTQLSSIDLTTMGGSEKLGDESKIGAFCTGLKYSLALFHRHNVKFLADVKGNTYIGGKDRDYRELFTTYTYIQEDGHTGKSKELLGIKVNREYESFMSQFDEDIFEFEDEQLVETSISTSLGWNWELWMALREIYSNMLDEGGYYTEEEPKTEKGTVITITFEEDSEFDSVWKDRQNYINESEWEYTVNYATKAIYNYEDRWLKIYKQNILVYEDRSCFSEFSYLVSSAEIDERRLLVNASSVKTSIRSAIISTDNKEFLRHIIKNHIEEVENGFLEEGTDYYSCSGAVIDVMEEVNEQFGEFRTYKFILSMAKKHPRYNFEGRTITTVKDSIWNYSKDVVIETVPKQTEEVKTIKQQIEVKFDIDLSEIDIQESKLSNSPVVADKFNKRLIVSESFDIETDMAVFIVEYVTLQSNRNIVTELSERLIERLRN